MAMLAAFMLIMSICKAKQAQIKTLIIYIHVADCGEITCYIFQWRYFSILGSFGDRLIAQKQNSEAYYDFSPLFAALSN